MADIYCPYCDFGNDIDHDDGYGYEENTKHQQDCSSCGKTFIYETVVTFNYYAVAAPCLNEEAAHDWKPIRSFPIKATKMECTICGEMRKPTKEEWINIEKNVFKL